MMAASSNRSGTTQVTIRRSFKSDQEADANASSGGALKIKDVSGYQVRKEGELSKVEDLYLDTLNGDSTKLDSATLFKGLKDQLETWPLYFHSKEESGVEMQQGFVTLWSNFLIAETLMASLSIQPLVTVPDIAHGWKFKFYGFIWMMSVISDFWGIAVTAVFLGYLLGCPNKVAWNWMCEIGWLRSIPSILVLLDTTLTLVAVAYTCWILYGYQMGIVCTVIELFFVGSSVKLAAILSKAGGNVTRRNME